MYPLCHIRYQRSVSTDSQKQSKRSLSTHNNKVVGSVQRTLVLCVYRIICAITDITIPSLVDSTIGFTQTIDNVIFIHDISKNKSFLLTDLSIWENALSCFNFSVSASVLNGVPYLYFLIISLSPGVYNIIQMLHMGSE